MLPAELPVPAFGTMLLVNWREFALPEGVPLSLALPGELVDVSFDDGVGKAKVPIVSAHKTITAPARDKKFTIRDSPRSS